MHWLNAFRKNVVRHDHVTPVYVTGWEPFSDVSLFNLPTPVRHRVKAVPNGYNAQLFSGLQKSEVWACGSAGYAIQAVGSGLKFLLCGQYLQSRRT